MKKSALILFLLLTITATISSSLMAYVVTPATKSPEEALQTLTDWSGLIVAGAVINLSSHYGPTPQRFQRPFIYTDVTLKPARVLKGRLKSSNVTFTILGGCIQEDDTCFSTDLYPTFKRGEKLTVYLKKGPQTTWVLTDPLYSVQPYKK